MDGKKTFQEAFCDQWGIARDAFAEAVLWHCVPPAHHFIGRLRWWLDRGYFQNDLELIQNIANCTTQDELQDEITLHYSIKPNYGFERGYLRARLSGQRLADLASSLLPPD